MHMFWILVALKLLSVVLRILRVLSRLDADRFLRAASALAHLAESTLKICTPKKMQAAWPSKLMEKLRRWEGFVGTFAVIVFALEFALNLVQMFRH
jgi:hypothetical protein